MNVNDFRVRQCAFFVISLAVLSMFQPNVSFADTDINSCYVAAQSETAPLAPNHSRYVSKDGSAMMVGEVISEDDTFINIRTCLGDFCISKRNWKCSDGKCSKPLIN